MLKKLPLMILVSIIGVLSFGCGGTTRVYLREPAPTVIYREQPAVYREAPSVVYTPAPTTVQPAGFYDRWGNWHPSGYYDAWGNWHAYH
ncbi:MAG: hypothetical protein HY313_08840 [Acidobacteria bacterium]|nr:hypothetical protein [Acidobacteriota bacterium]